MRFLVALFVVGCAAGAEKSPPPTYSIGAEFSPEQAAIIQDAVGSWCSAVGWCPELAKQGERGHFGIHADYGSLPCPVGSNACNYDGNVWFDAHGSALGSHNALWLAAAHEAGHFGIEGHPVEFPYLMAEAVGTISTKLEVDPPSAGAWCSQGCD